MSSLATTSALAEKVRVAVACFRAAERSADKLYVLVEAHPLHLAGQKQAEREGIQRLAVRRIYAGEHKNLDGKWTVVIGFDLAEAAPTPLAIPLQHGNYEVTVRTIPYGADAPFEGIFDLKSIDIEKS